jgi:hypothetical protein
MKKKQIAIIALAGWLILIFILMILSQIVDFEVFFILALIGLLVIMKVMEQKFVQPGYLRNFWYLITIGIIVFGIIAVHKTIKNL